MGKLLSFAITLSNAQGVYYAGHMVEGQIIIELSDTLKMRGVRLEFNGRAYVHWTETHSTGSGDDRRTETVHYSAQEQYFNQEIVLAGRWKNQPGQNIELHAGQHTFPFAFQLPTTIPSSFEGAHGYVRYTLKGTIDKPWKFDHTTKRPFTVISVLDLNTIPQAGLPIQATNSKVLCCLCCASGPISAVFTLDRKGYVPGETILLKAEIDNKSNRKMASSNVVFKMNTVFHATASSRSSQREVARIFHGPISEGGSDYWNGDQLLIPPLPPSYLSGCRIIDVMYSLELRVDPTGIGFDLVVPLEVIIGTVPLQQVVAQYHLMAPPSGPPMLMSGASADAAHNQLPGAVAPDPVMSNNVIHDLPPPSYAECVFGKVDVRDEYDTQYTQGETNFAPIYTYYNWDHTPSAPLTEKEQK